MRYRIRMYSLVLIATALPAACGLREASTVPVSEVGPIQAATAPVSQIFALVRPGPAAGEVLLARATEQQPGGPETLVPVRVQPYRPVSLAPHAVIRITAPYYEGHLTDWISGALVTPAQFGSLVRRAETKYGPLPNRARMFHVTLDGQGRVNRMQHIFSP